jgi:hypothetical protein
VAIALLKTELPNINSSKDATRDSSTESSGSCSSKSESVVNNADIVLDAFFKNSLTKELSIISECLRDTKILKKIEKTLLVSK